MSFSTIMVQLQLEQSNAGTLQITGDLAERYHASVIGAALCQPAQIIYGDGYVTSPLIEQDREKVEKAIAAAEAEYRAALHPRVTNLEWRSAVSFASLSGILANAARSADILITSVDRNVPLFDQARHVDIGDLVMRAGRPVLIVPPAIDELKLEHVVVGWKDTKETRRAVFDALPLLEIAGHVTLAEITAEDQLDPARARLQDVAAWLKRHGILSESVAIPSAGDDAVRLSAIARERNADLIVAGAYGHSRVREWVLGGVTRELLLHSSRCSFVSH